MEEFAITLLSINHRYDDHHRIRFDVMVNGWVPHQQESESCLYAILLFLLLTIISSYGKSRAKRKEVKKEEKLQRAGVGSGCGDWQSLVHRETAPALFSRASHQNDTPYGSLETQN